MTKNQKKPTPPNIKKQDPLNVEFLVNAARGRLHQDVKKELDALVGEVRVESDTVRKGEIIRLIGGLKAEIRQRAEVMTIDMMRSAGASFYYPVHKDQEQMPGDGLQLQEGFKGRMQRMIDTVTSRGGNLDDFEFRVGEGVLEELGVEMEEENGPVYKGALNADKEPSSIPIVVDPDVPPGHVYLVEKKEA